MRFHLAFESILLGRTYFITSFILPLSFIILDIRPQSVKSLRIAFSIGFPQLGP